ncbi:hypothetical protein M432DRAFT_285932 [Thermoascus aurantiacus ATCC 26904]
MPQTRWEKTLEYSKKGFDKAWQTLDKLGAPVNRLSNRVGAEAFWPMTLDEESNKAARILQSFCKDGFYDDIAEPEDRNNGKINRPQGKQRVLKKIPAEVIKRAKGLAIFTTMRTGLWVSGSGGSGVLLARIPETGEWSPPSGIMLHTAGLGFLVGVDIYDCVVVINTYEALEAFKKVRCTLGGEISATAGPVGVGGILETEVHKRQAPIWTYMKSRGFYAGVQIDGTIIIERTDENQRFYGEGISVTDILAGKVKQPPASLKTLMQTVKAAQGDIDVDESLLPPQGETAGDGQLATGGGGGSGGGTFGIPASDDPDPYGVKALEAEGLFIREAGTKARPSHEVFEFRPSPSSPIYTTFSRLSVDGSRRNSWRGSLQSYASVDKGTQTEDLLMTAGTSVSRASSRAPSIKDVTCPSPEQSSWDISNGRIRINGDHGRPKDDYELNDPKNAKASKHESIKSAPAAIEDQTTLSESRRMSPTFTRARLVTIPKRTPPALPPRNPERKRDSSSSSTASSVALPSPTSSLSQPEATISEEPNYDGAADGATTNGVSDEAPKEVESKADAVVNGTSHRAENSHTASNRDDKDEFHSMPSSPGSEKETPIREGKETQDESQTKSVTEIEPKIVAGQA